MRAGRVRFADVPSGAVPCPADAVESVIRATGTGVPVVPDASAGLISGPLPATDGPAAGPSGPSGRNYAAPFATGPSPVRTGAERRGRRRSAPPVPARIQEGPDPWSTRQQSGGDRFHSSLA